MLPNLDLRSIKEAQLIQDRLILLIIISSAHARYCMHTHAIQLMSEKTANRLEPYNPQKRGSILVVKCSAKSPAAQELAIPRAKLGLQNWTIQIYCKSGAGRTLLTAIKLPQVCRIRKQEIKHIVKECCHSGGGPNHACSFQNPIQKHSIMGT